MNILVLVALFVGLFAVSSPSLTSLSSSSSFVTTKSGVFQLPPSGLQGHIDQSANGLPLTGVPLHIHSSSLPAVLIVGALALGVVAALYAYGRMHKSNVSVSW